MPLYTISIIRGRGIDQNAIRYILSRHEGKDLQFVDGWTGKGVIYRELRKEISRFPGVSPDLAVLADPSSIGGRSKNSVEFRQLATCIAHSRRCTRSMYFFCFSV